MHEHSYFTYIMASRSHTLYADPSPAAQDDSASE